MDEEFEVFAAQVLMRAEAMVNKYRRLLMVEAEVGVHEQTCERLYYSNCIILNPFCCSVKKTFQFIQNVEGHCFTEGEVTFTFV